LKVHRQHFSLLSTVSIFVLDCSQPGISLSPYRSLITAPIEIERSQDFSISSTLNLHCLKSLATIKQWIIQTCPTSLCPVQERFEEALTSMTSGELYIPARTLEYGIYLMNLTVTMSASPQSISSAITYVKIVPSHITVKLVQFGPAMITRGQQQILVLDPGRFSIDPDQAVFNSNVSIIDNT
jgi:hypothetical protein